MKPDSAPQNTPLATAGLPTSRATCAEPIQLYSTKAMVVTPMNMRTAASEICAAKAQAAPTPTIAPGITMVRMRPFQSLR